MIFPRVFLKTPSTCLRMLQLSATVAQTWKKSKMFSMLIQLTYLTAFSQMDWPSTSTKLHMVIGSHQRLKLLPAIILRLNNASITKVNTYKYLGVVLYSIISWSLVLTTWNNNKNRKEVWVGLSLLTAELSQRAQRTADRSNGRYFPFYFDGEKYRNCLK